jgi:regulator of sirC expression with transglutaminase-like and TPR domain
MLLRYAFGSFAIVLAVSLTVAAQDATPPPPLSPEAVAEIKQFVRELDSEDFAVRERASFRLRQMDERVLPFLDEALGSKSPEVRLRAGSLLKQMRVDPLEAFCAQRDDQLDVEQGLFFIAQILNPKLKREEITRQLDDIAGKVRTKLGKDYVAAKTDPLVAVNALRTVLFDELKFNGNKDDYNNPDNCSLARILETKKGKPITLSRFVVLIAKRVEIPIVGVPASGRYLVKYDGQQAPAGFAKTDIYFHPFEGGKILSREDRQMLYPDHDPDVMVPPDSNREVLSRVLRNLTSDLDHAPEKSTQMTRAVLMLELLQTRQLPR